MKFGVYKDLMAKNKSLIFNLAASVFTLAALTACGGGGSGSTTQTSATTSTSSTVNTQTVAAVQTTQLVVAVGSPSYAAGSEELLAFNLLNAERAQCGFGKLAQNTQIDAAAKAHADYQLINNVLSHNENFSQFPIGFTGNTGFDRVIAAGYTGPQQTGDETTVKTFSANKLGEGQAGIRRLLSAPYHASGMLGGFRDVGLSIRSNTESTPNGVNPGVFVQVNLAYKTADGPQRVAAGEVATYPCAGSTGINRQLTNEEPSPTPGRNLSTNPLGGAIYILLIEGNILTIASAVMFETVSNTAITLRTPVTSVNDPNTRFKANEGYVIPDAPLKPLTQHSVDIRGTNNGVAFTKQFTFVTGS